KAIVIFTAFLPQFVDPQNYWVSFLICGVLFLLLEWCAIALYAGVGKALATSTNVGVVRWFVRGSGVTMIAFGALLAFARREPA
ncbi:MAG: LysE family translocator, partial [Pseudomonadota bacterium]